MSRGINCSKGKVPEDRAGDGIRLAITGGHIYNNHQHGILDADGKVLPEVLEARQRGVLFDPAHGTTHFSF